MSKITQFQKKVYQAVKLIPLGKISTYKLVAQYIGNPNASRAVGTALKQNPFAPIVPCHRVLTSSYQIGGFLGQTDLKSNQVKKKVFMLKQEGIKFNQNKVVNDENYRNQITFKF